MRWKNSSYTILLSATLPAATCSIVNRLACGLNVTVSLNVTAKCALATSGPSTVVKRTSWLAVYHSPLVVTALISRNIPGGAPASVLTMSDE